MATIETVVEKSLSTDAVFETLGSQRRRYALHYLRQTGGTCTIRELAEQIAAWELGKEPAAVTPKERKRLYTALHQTHLPKMDTLGVAAYDRNRGVVTVTEHIDQFDIFLDVVPKNDLPWSQFYLGFGSVLTALVTVATLGLAPFDTIGGYTYALGISVCLTLVAAYHTLRDRPLRIGSTDVPPDTVVRPLEASESSADPADVAREKSNEARTGTMTASGDANDD